MKQELLTAVVLLATGAALWFWQNNHETSSQESNWLRSEQGFENTNRQVASENTFVNHASTLMSQASSVQQASWQSDLAQAKSESAPPANPQIDTNNKSALLGSDGSKRNTRKDNSNAMGRQKSTVPAEIETDAPANLKIAHPDPAAQQLLFQLAKQINTSGPIQSTFSLRSTLYDTNLTAEGRFWQIGQGTRKARMELAFSDQPIHRSLLQICDGRFVYHVKQTGAEQKINFIDLDRLRNQDAHLSVATTPASWIGQGSLASLFDHLRMAFKFDPPQVQSDNGTTVYHLTGDWRPRELYQLLDGVVPKRHLTPVIELGKTPEQIPHSIKLEVRSDNNGQLTPVAIRFYRFDDTSIDPSTAYDRPMVEVKFNRFDKVAMLDSRLFTLQSSDGESVDMTDDYNRRVEELTKDLPKVANQNSEIR